MQDHLTTLQPDYFFERSNVCQVPGTTSDSFADYSEIALITLPSYCLFLRRSGTSHKHAFKFVIGQSAMKALLSLADHF
jgi:hypothetical protein